MLRLTVVVLLLAFVVAVPFAIWGQNIEEVLSVDSMVEKLRGTGWAWAAGIGLIISDIALPVPSTAVMAALGIIYGPVIGGACSAAGSTLAGSLGYWLCRSVGPRTTERLVGPEGLAEARRLFDRWGLLLVALSRWLPVLPETVAFVAGLTRMPFQRFLLALVCGTLPLGFLFATAGHIGRDAPFAIMALCALAPIALWALARTVLRSPQNDHADD